MLWKLFHDENLWQHFFYFDSKLRPDLFFSCQLIYVQNYLCSTEVCVLRLIKFHDMKNFCVEKQRKFLNNFGFYFFMKSRYNLSFALNWHQWRLLSKFCSYSAWWIIMMWIVAVMFMNNYLWERLEKLSCFHYNEPHNA